MNVNTGVSFINAAWFFMVSETAITLLIYSLIIESLLNFTLDLSLQIAFSLPHHKMASKVRADKGQVLMMA